jgi:hypothetical protein
LLKLASLSVPRFLTRKVGTKLASTSVLRVREIQQDLPWSLTYTPSINRCAIKSGSTSKKMEKVGSKGCPFFFGSTEVRTLDLAFAR